MTTEQIHSCSYYCDRPECIKAQRDELREKYFAAADDAERLEWILRQGDEFTLHLIVDAPCDGEYYCNGAFSDGQGKTPKEAIDAAMKQEKE